MKMMVGGNENNRKQQRDGLGLTDYGEERARATMTTR